MSINVNTTLNETQPLNCSSFPTASKTVAIFAYCLIFVISLAGNFSIGIIVYKTKTMRKPINFLIVNMAMSDLLFLIFLIPRKLLEFYVCFWLISGPLGQALCKLVFFVRYVSLTVSIQSLVLIAVDRFGAVVFPLRSPFVSSKLCPFFILATWIVALVTWSPFLFTYKVVEFSGGLICGSQWSEVFGENKSFEYYMLTIYVVDVYAPLVLITMLYIIIYFKLKSQTTPGEQSTNARRQRAKTQQNVLKMAVAIVLGFAVCWLPITIKGMLIFFLSDIRSLGFSYFAPLASFLSYASCAVNPCICFLFSVNYRQSLKNLFRCSWAV